MQAYDWLHVLDWALTDKLPHATIAGRIYLAPVGVDDIPVIVRPQLPANALIGVTWTAPICPLRGAGIRENARLLTDDLKALIWRLERLEGRNS